MYWIVCIYLLILISSKLCICMLRWNNICLNKYMLTKLYIIDSYANAYVHILILINGWGRSNRRINNIRHFKILSHFFYLYVSIFLSLFLYIYIYIYIYIYKWYQNTSLCHFKTRILKCDYMSWGVLVV